MSVVYLQIGISWFTLQEIEILTCIQNKRVTLNSRINTFLQNKSYEFASQVF